MTDFLSIGSSLEAAAYALGVENSAVLDVGEKSGLAGRSGELELGSWAAAGLRARDEDDFDLDERAEDDPFATCLRAHGIFCFVAVRLQVAGKPFLCAFAARPMAISKARIHVFRTLAATFGSTRELATRRASADENRVVEDALAERLRFFESIVTNVNDAVLVTGASPTDEPGPVIEYVNPAFTRMTGYSLAEVVGKTPRILQGVNTNADAQSRLHRALETWTPIEIELLNYRKNGTPFYVELSIVPIADETGWYTHWVSVQRDVTERTNATMLRAHDAEEINDELTYLAFHDDLTTLRNRAYFLDRLAHTLKRAHAPMPRQSALLFIDLDGFKLINDTLGHAAGDVLLTEVARRLTTCVRPGDLLARMGGDEFAILVDNIAESSDVTAVAERILKQLRLPVRLAGKSIFAHASIGISYVDARYASSEEILQNADSAMYRAKREGGMCYSFFDEEMHLHAVATLTLLKQLRGAVDRNELKVFYQPVVDIESGAIDGLEALVRWEHPERGIVGPSEFIGLAEDTGIITTIGSFVLAQACRDVREWLEIEPALTLSVNVSARQFYDASFIDTLESVLAASGLPASTLQLEITETIFLDNAPYVGDMLARIRALGIRLALDDFGTGYSSLSYLERFRLDTLKIDRAFTQRTTQSETGLAIVRAIVALARALDMRIVGEGVETEDQRRALRDVGCDLAQGFLFSRALPALAIAKLLAENRTQTWRAL